MLSISVSLVAVFIPILLMGGIVGRLFREFAVTFSRGDRGFAWCVSLTTTPMMCAHLLQARTRSSMAGCIAPVSAASTGSWIVRPDAARGAAASGHHAAGAARHIGLNVYLYISVPKGFFPQQDTGRMTGTIQADQDTSFQAMQGMLLQMVESSRADPAVETVTAFTGGSGGGGSTINTAA